MSLRKELTELLELKIQGIKTVQDKVQLGYILDQLKDLLHTLSTIINSEDTPKKYRLKCIEEQRKLLETIYNVTYKEIPLKNTESITTNTFYTGVQSVQWLSDSEE